MDLTVDQVALQLQERATVGRGLEGMDRDRYMEERRGSRVIETRRERFGFVVAKEHRTTWI
jgi:hypothetical protein